MKQLTVFPPDIQRLVSDMTEEQLQNALITEGVFRDCPAVTTTQIGLSLAVSIAVDLRSFRHEKVMLLTFMHDEARWTALIRTDDRCVVAAMVGESSEFRSLLAELGFRFHWDEQFQRENDTYRLSAFEQFLVIATRKGYCSNPYCTTCGAAHFKRGMILLSLGAWPESMAWLSLRRSMKEGLVINRQSIYSSERFCRRLACFNPEELDRACGDSGWRQYRSMILSEVQKLNTSGALLVRHAWERLEVSESRSWRRVTHDPLELRDDLLSGELSR
jgi:hypothetical protein